MIPIEATLACVEVKTTLTKKELGDAFDKFQEVQEMEFVKERVARVSSDADGAGMSVSQTSPPELILFAYEASLSDDAIREAYARDPMTLRTVKICVLQKGIVGDLASPVQGLGWLRPKEDETHRIAGQVLAMFLFQFLLPALFKQTKGQGFYVKYLEGRSTFSVIR